MDLKPLPTQERLQFLLKYDPESGKLSWKNRPFGSRVIPGGNDLDGSLSIHIDGVKYRQHRIIFKLLKGYDPVWVDHKNWKPNDNSETNLRNANPSQNGINRQPKHGLPQGVHKFKGRYRAMIAHKHIGVYNTVEEAHKAYTKKRKELYGEF